LNLLGDFAGGGMLCAMGILIALYERQLSGKGQVVDAAMVDGASYLSTFVIKMRQKGLWNASRGENALDTGAPYYEVYKTKDDKYMSV
jgi:alpha-methylacyl-CoA racemase